MFYTHWLLFLRSATRDMTLSRATSTPVLDFTSHGHEGLLHIGGILSTGLQEWDANLISKGLRLTSSQLHHRYRLSHKHANNVTTRSSAGQMTACFARLVASIRSISSQCLHRPLYNASTVTCTLRVMLRNYLCCLVVHYFLRCQITLVTHQ